MSKASSLSDTRFVIISVRHLAEDMTDELREALAVRAVCHRTLVPETP